MDAILSQLTGLVAVILAFGSVAGLWLVPLAIVRLRGREREAMLATMRAAIEKGQALPAELVAALGRQARPSPMRDLRAGILWLAVALGLAASALAGHVAGLGPQFRWLLGAAPLPGLVGLAYLALALIGTRRGET